MLQNKTWLFIGNRSYVLEVMLKKKLRISKMLAPENSFLARKAGGMGLELETFTSRSDLIDKINRQAFDILISNGCPFILPLEKITNREKKQFINIHPAPLPEIKGKHAVTAALLEGRNGGATCHVMAPEVDAGSVIAKIEIPYSEDLEDGFSHKISFMAEARAFEQAFERNFEPLAELPPSGNLELLHYNIQPEDSHIDPDMETAELIRHVRAFSDRAECASFSASSGRLYVEGVALVKNPFVCAMFRDNPHRAVLVSWNHGFCLKHGANILKFRCRTGQDIPAEGESL